MTIHAIMQSLSLKSFTGTVNGEKTISDSYVSDLLSDVMANCREGSLWITLQTHMNIVAVASMKKIPAIILINGRKPDDEALRKAEAEGVALLGTTQPAFEVAGKLYSLLKRGVME
ncbi:MAG: serine kinase [bacterium]